MKPTSKPISIVQGFYPSFIYLLPSQTILEEPFFQQLVNIIKQSQVKGKFIEELHFSLSKTFFPLLQEVQPLAKKIRGLLQTKKIVLPVILIFKRVQILQNFITITVEKITQDRCLPMAREIQKITGIPYYQSPIFHVSIFKIEAQINQEVLARIHSVSIHPKKSYLLSKLQMRSGQKVYNLGS